MMKRMILVMATLAVATLAGTAASGQSRAGACTAGAFAGLLGSDAPHLAATCAP